MVKVTGRDAVKAYLRQLPEEIEGRLLRGAGRAAVKVVADEARTLVRSDEVRDAIVTNVRRADDRIIARVQVKGRWENAVGNWLEYGTDPHVISVDLEASGGRTARRLNSEAKAGSLVIGGAFVGATVYHPGAPAHPFMRTALDNKEAEAIAAAQSYINARIRGGRIVGGDEGEDA